jgi:nucleotide-binding universal stress UspA family protein
MKVLLPTDGSPASLAAVHHALHLRRAGLPLQFVLINVQPPATLYEVVVTHDNEVLDEIKRGAGADLLAPAEALLDAAQAEYESEVASGAPETLLLELLENYGCEAVIVGANRPQGLGPVATALLTHSPVPVTLVRYDEAAD